MKALSPCSNSSSGLPKSFDSITTSYGFLEKFVNLKGFVLPCVA